MIDVCDKAHQPDIGEIEAYIGIPLARDFRAHLEARFGARHEIAYSGDMRLPGWNVRFYRAGRTLCRLYPARGGFQTLVVIGPREKAGAEAMLPDLDARVRAVYEGTQEGMGQRWMIFDVPSLNEAYGDLMRLIALRAQSKAAAARDRRE